MDVINDNIQIMDDTYMFYLEKKLVFSAPMSGVLYTQEVTESGS